MTAIALALLAVLLIGLAQRKSGGRAFADQPCLLYNYCHQWIHWDKGAMEWVHRDTKDRWDPAGHNLVTYMNSIMAEDGLPRDPAVWEKATPHPATPDHYNPPPEFTDFLPF